MINFLSKSFLALAICLMAIDSNGAVRVKMRVSATSTEVLSVTPTDAKLAPGQSRLIKSQPFFIPEGAPPSAEMFQEYEMDESQAGPMIWNQMASENIAGAEFREIYVQGPYQNRINLTILGDGYTEAEKQKFFDDVNRTVQGLFGGNTFKSYLPLFNIYAVYTPSRTSGIGDGSSKDTAFGLYRSPRGSKRAIMPGNTGALESALRMAPATDYPIVIANDNYYGGLGGRYAISTSSVRSGLIVLRHELGHNFGEVGEEYDNGYVYSGANASSSPRTSWAHWTSGPIQPQEARIVTGDYVWKDLSTGPYTAQFTIPRGFDLLYMIISSVGWETPNDVVATLNGNRLPLVGDYHDDRSFFDVAATPVTAGQNYSLKIEEQVRDSDNVLGFAVAFVVPANYDFTPNKIGAYATYDANGSKTYRPTHESCLMRNMLLDHFCSVDQENMWHQFLNRIKLVDSLKFNATNQEVKLVAQKLEGLKVEWFDISSGREVAIPELSNSLVWTRTNPAVTKVRAKLQFTTPEVRKYSNRFTDVAEVNLR